MLVPNFSHSLTSEQVSPAEALAGQKVERVIEARAGGSGEHRDGGCGTGSRFKSEDSRLKIEIQNPESKIENPGRGERMRGKRLADVEVC